MTVGLAPVTAGQQTCAGAGPAEICVDDPLVHDAGQATVADGDVSAQANGGLATGVGSATFVVDYQLEDQTIDPDEQVYMSIRLIVQDSAGDLVEVNGTSATLEEAGSTEGELQATIDTLTPKLEGGTITVEVDATRSDDGNVTKLGEAVSMAPITVLVSPPSDVAERTNVGQTQVGTFEAGPDEGQASVADGELFVADGTSIRLQATGELSTQSLQDVSFYDQRASASLAAQIGDADYRVDSTPISEYCQNACSADAETVEVELSLVLPADEDLVSDLDLDLDANWVLRTPGDWGYQTERTFADAHGSNEIVGVGP